LTRITAAKSSFCYSIDVLSQHFLNHDTEHTETQQNTGNHKKPDAPDKHGADRFGGTRAGAENIEKTSDKPSR